MEKKIKKKVVIKTIKDFGLKIEKIIIEKIPNCCNPFKNQYNDECLLYYFLLKYKPSILIITDKDVHVERLNFAFGLEYSFNGCIVSFYRLKTKKQRAILF